MARERAGPVGGEVSECRVSHKPSSDALEVESDDEVLSDDTDDMPSVAVSLEVEEDPVNKETDLLADLAIVELSTRWPGELVRKYGNNRSKLKKLRTSSGNDTSPRIQDNIDSMVASSSADGTSPQIQDNLDCSPTGESEEINISLPLDSPSTTANESDEETSELEYVSAASLSPPEEARPAYIPGARKSQTCSLRDCGMESDRVPLFQIPGGKFEEWAAIVDKAYAMQGKNCLQQTSILERRDRLCGLHFRSQDIYVREPYVVADRPAPGKRVQLFKGTKIAFVCRADVNSALLSAMCGPRGIIDHQQIYRERTGVKAEEPEPEIPFKSPCDVEPKVAVSSSCTEDGVSVANSVEMEVPSVEIPTTQIAQMLTKWLGKAIPKNCDDHAYAKKLDTTSTNDSNIPVQEDRDGETPGKVVRKNADDHADSMKLDTTSANDSNLPVQEDPDDESGETDSRSLDATKLTENVSAPRAAEALPVYTPTRQKYEKYENCALRDCCSKSHRIPLFRVPQGRFEEWASVVKKAYADEVKNGFLKPFTLEAWNKLCALHFRTEDLIIPGVKIHRTRYGKRVLLRKGAKIAFIRRADVNSALLSFSCGPKGIIDHQELYKERTCRIPDAPNLGTPYNSGCYFPMVPTVVALPNSCTNRIPPLAVSQETSSEFGTAQEGQVLAGQPDKLAEENSSHCALYTGTANSGNITNPPTQEVSYWNADESTDTNSRERGILLPLDSALPLAVPPKEEEDALLRLEIAQPVERFPSRTEQLVQKDNGDHTDNTNTASLSNKRNPSVQDDFNCNLAGGSRETNNSLEGCERSAVKVPRFLVCPTAVVIKLLESTVCKTCGKSSSVIEFSSWAKRLTVRMQCSGNCGYWSWSSQYGVVT